MRQKISSVFSRTMIFMFIFMLALKSHSQDTIKYSRLAAHSGCIFYKKGDKSPFTGIVCYKIRFTGRKNYMPMENGILNGKGFGYYRSGAKKFEATFVSGEKNGQEIGYYESGKIQSSWFYINGQENGEEILYHENGQIKVVSQVKDDKLNGKSIRYDSDGNKESEEEYENGISISIIYYNTDGTINSSYKKINKKWVKQEIKT